MAYVYIHIRNDNGNVFYVGISDSHRKGKYFRSKTKDSRSILWKRVVDKAGGFQVNILHDNITWEEACEIESRLIKTHGRICDNTGTLVNLTDGGEGVNGLRGTIPWNKGKKLHYDVWFKGKKMSEERRLKLSERMKIQVKTKGHHFQGKKHSAETIQKLIMAKKGKKLSEFQRQAIINSRHRKRVFVYRKSGEFIGEFESHWDCTKKLNLGRGMISRVLKGEFKSCKGYKFSATKVRTVWLNLYPEDWYSTHETQEAADLAQSKDDLPPRLGNRAYPIEITEE